MADSKRIWGLLKETIVWLRSRGSDQWSTWPTWGGPEGKVTRALAAGSVWLVVDRGQLVATITVEAHGDPDFWTPDERAEPALYVSKLAVRRSHAGQGIGALLLDWSRDLAHRAGVRWVRLDAWRTNIALRDYYTARGWQFVRDVDNPHRSSGALFQLPAAPLSLDQALKLREDGRGKPARPSTRRRTMRKPGKHRAGWRPKR